MAEPNPHSVPDGDDVDDKKRQQRRRHLDALLSYPDIKAAGGPASYCKSVIDILREYPDLAKEEYTESRVSPLHRLIAIGPAVSRHSGVETVLDIYPDAAACKTSNGILPIHDAMNFQEGSSLLRRLLSAYPPSVSIRPSYRDWTGFCPLEVAFAKNYNQEMLDYMISLLPPDMDFFYLMQDYSDVLPVELVQNLTRILPQLTKFHCDVRRYSEESFFALLDALVEAPRLVRVKCSLPAHLIFRNPRVISALQNFVQNNQGLSSLHFQFPYGSTGTRSESNDDQTEDSELVKALAVGLESNQNLKELELENFVVMHGNEICSLIANAAAPPTLHLTETVIGSRSQSKIHGVDWATSRIQDLQFTRCPIGNETILSLLYGIAQMPGLTKLNLGMCSYRPENSGPYLHNVKVTKAVVAILNQTILESFEATGLCIDINAVCKNALRNNTTLKEFMVEPTQTCELSALASTLEQYNTTLIMVDTAMDKSKGAQVNYWTLLNQYGRQKLRDVSATVIDLIYLLSTASTETSSCRDSVNVCFGLLKEGLNLWCNTNAVKLS